MTAKSSIDLSGWEAGLAKLQGPLRVSLARSMGVAGGKVLRDEAKRRAPVLKPGSEGKDNQQAGLLRDSIYLAYKEGMSTSTKLTYGVSWNSRIAKHGHFIEFGHWQPFQVVYDYGEGFSTLAKGKGGGPNAVPQKQKDGGPVWVEAKPFLRPAYHVAKGQAKDAMIERGRQRLPELLAGKSNEP
jgi:hypothetical protein